VLPPGALIRRLVPRPAGGVWLATDHGLLEADALEARFRRAASPAGARACGDLAEGDGLPDGARAVALCQPTLLALGSALPGETPPVALDESALRAPSLTPSSIALPPGADAADRSPAQPVAPLAEDPPVDEIRRRALERVGLSVERADTLWRGLRRRAYWPSLELRGAWDADRDRGRSRDQTFVSGDTRDLYDRDRGEGRHYAAAVVFDWDLGGLAYPEDSVDLYRELRQVTSLRDDVADEIHQLYFERQRIRARLAQPEALQPGEAVELGLRAAELDSGLDAWTGGWIGAWRAARASAPDSVHPGPRDRSVD
jgi:hypothetical protein